MARTRHNPETKTFRGRSYKKGRRVSELKNQDRFADFDEETGCWGVFDDTGFCHALYSGPEEAQENV
jgi:hypothetical protein